MEKSQIIQKLNKILKERIATAQKSMTEITESRDGETKSSVGDKYETGRAMAQMELKKTSDQLSQSIKLKKALYQINTNKKCDIAEFGSIVSTNLGDYFISVGFGKIEIDDQKVFCISMASPIGKLLEGKGIGESITFQGRNIQINQIS